MTKTAAKFTYQLRDGEYLLRRNGEVFGWVRETGPVDQRFVVKIYGYHLFTELTLARALRAAVQLVRS